MFNLAVTLICDFRRKYVRKIMMPISISLKSKIDDSFKTTVAVYNMKSDMKLTSFWHDFFEPIFKLFDF